MEYREQQSPPIPHPFPYKGVTQVYMENETPTLDKESRLRAMEEEKLKREKQQT